MTLKIVIVSDTHCELSQLKIPDGDIFIHCGDWSYLGQQPELIKFGRDLRKLPHKHKIIIPGNHDLTLDFWHEKFHKDAKKWLKLDDRSHLLINSCIELEGLNFVGSSMIPKIGNWAFGYSELKKQHFYNHIDNVDILITHSPPKGIMDEEGYGCPVLLDFVNRVKPKIHCFGHCHEGYGKLQINDTLFINAASMNRGYKLANKPIVIEIDDDNNITRLCEKA